MNRDKIMICLFIVIGFGIFLYFQSVNDSTSLDERLVSIKKTIIAANRPRIITFTAPWCPACQQFKPVLKKVMANYSRSVDCEILNVDDKVNKAMVKTFEVKSIPATYVFDRSGNVVFKHIGYIDSEELDNYIRKTIL
jgi:thioredoxin-like negative regulator of GroEL